MKNKFNNKVKADFIAFMENMLSEQTVDLLNSGKYTIEDIVSYEKKKNAKRVNVNIADEKQKVKIGIQVQEVYSEIKDNFISDYHVRLNNNRINKTILYMLSEKVMKIICHDIITIKEEYTKLIDKAIVNFEKLQEHTVYYDSEDNVVKLSRRKICSKLYNLTSNWAGEYRTAKDNLNKDQLKYVTKKVNELFKECFDLNIIKIDLEQSTYIKDGITVAKVVLGKDATLLPCDDYLHNKKPVLSYELLDDILNTDKLDPSKIDSFGRMGNEKLRALRRCSVYTVAEYSIYSINAQDFKLLKYLKQIDIEKQNKYHVECVIPEKFNDLLNKLNMSPTEAFAANQNIINSLKVYKDLIDGVYKHPKLHNETVLNRFIRNMEKFYPYLTKYRLDRNDMDIILNADISFKVIKSKDEEQN